MHITLNIMRQAAGAPAEASFQSYSVDTAEDATVMDAMLQVRDEQDGGLGFRAGCLRGFCGDCAYRISGTGDLACLTPIAKVAKEGAVNIEPVRHIGLLRDLVYDLDPFLWDKVKAVRPGLTAPDTPPAQEALMEPAVVEDLQTVMSCVMCGLCDEGCTVITVDSKFLGPAALTKAYRTVKDPRNSAAGLELDLMEKPHGVWDCTHCYEANGHCPKKEINPTYRILAVREMLMERGIKNKAAARYHESFTSSVKRSGWVDEGHLAISGIGWTNIWGLMKFLPTAFRAIRRGKAPLPYLHKKRPGADRIKRIFEKVERK